MTEPSPVPWDPAGGSGLTRHLSWTVLLSLSTNFILWLIDLSDVNITSITGNTSSISIPIKVLSFVTTLFIESSPDTNIICPIQIFF